MARRLTGARGESRGSKLKMPAMDSLAQSPTRKTAAGARRSCPTTAWERRSAGVRADSHASTTWRMPTAAGYSSPSCDAGRCSGVWVLASRRREQVTCPSPKSNPGLSTTTFAGRARGPNGSTPLKTLRKVAVGECAGSWPSRPRRFRHTSVFAAIARCAPSVGPSGGLAPLVAMMQAADSRMTDDLGIAIRLRGGRSHRRRALAQPEVCPIVVVVRDKLGE